MGGVEFMRSGPFYVLSDGPGGSVVQILCDLDHSIWLLCALGVGCLVAMPHLAGALSRCLRQPLIFYDKLCIPQEDKVAQRESIAKLGVTVGRGRTSRTSWGGLRAPR